MCTHIEAYYKIKNNKNEIISNSTYTSHKYIELQKKITRISYV